MKKSRLLAKVKRLIVLALSGMINMLTQYEVAISKGFLYASLCQAGDPANEATPLEQVYWVNLDRPLGISDKTKI